MRTLLHNNRRWLLSLVAMLLIGMSPANQALAQKLYAVTGSGGATSVLYEINPDDGSVVNTIGSTGYSHMTGLAMHPQTGVMYGFTNTPNYGQGFLVTIDLTTGAATPVGSMTGIQSPDIAFSPDGTLYAWAEGGSGFNDDLVTIDLTTGAATLVTNPAVGTYQTGIAFHSSGAMVLKVNNSLYVSGPPAWDFVYVANLNVNAHNMLDFRNELEMYTGERISGGLRLYKVLVDGPNPAATLVGTIPIGGISAIAFGGSRVLLTTTGHCAKDTLTVTYTPADDEEVADVIWTRDGDTISNAHGLRYITNTKGNYQATVLNTLGEYYESKVVSQGVGIPKIVMSGNGKVCDGQSVDIHINPSTNTDYTTYQWNLDGNPIGGETTTQIYADAAGAYTLTATRGGCSATSLPKAVTVKPNPAVTLLFYGTPITESSVVGMCSASVTPLSVDPQPGYVYYWNRDGKKVGSGPSYSAKTPGEYIVKANLDECYSESVPLSIIYSGPWDPLESTCRHASLSIL